jgi:pentatricopeptide repeat protein
VNYLLIAYANTGDAKGAFDTLSRYKNTGFIPDTKTVNTLLKAIENSADPVYVKKLENFASNFWGNDLIADHVTLKIAASIFKKSGELKAAKWLNGLMDQGFKGTNYLLDRLAPYLDDKRFDELCSRLGPEEKAARAAAVKMPSRATSPLVAQPRRSWTPGGASSTGEHVPYEVIEIINEAQLVKAKYSALLDKYSEVGDTASIEGIFKEMKIRGIPLNIFHYNHLLRCHAFNKSFSQAQKVVKECTDLGLKLTTSSMHHLCEASVRSSNPFNPEQVLLDMQLLGMQPGTSMLLKAIRLTCYTSITLPLHYPTLTCPTSPYFTLPYPTLPTASNRPLSAGSDHAGPC